jgi:hypothetical protein
LGKKIFGIYLAKLDAPNSEAHARLELPASPWELHDAMDKVQLQENEELYLEIDDYYGFEYLAPHLMELDASLNELNDLAGRLAVLDETEQEAFDGLLRLEIQRKVESNGSILTMQDLRDLAISAGADCCHVVGATSDAELGRFYAENGFMEELDGLSDDVFEWTLAKSAKPCVPAKTAHSHGAAMWCSTVNWSPHHPAPRNFPKSRNISSGSPLAFIPTSKMTAPSRWNCLRLLKH